MRIIADKKSNIKHKYDINLSSLIIKKIILENNNYLVNFITFLKKTIVNCNKFQKFTLAIEVNVNNSSVTTRLRNKLLILSSIKFVGEKSIDSLFV